MTVSAHDRDCNVFVGGYCDCMRVPGHKRYFQCEVCDDYAVWEHHDDTGDVAHACDKHLVATLSRVRDHKLYPVPRPPNLAAMARAVGSVDDQEPVPGPAPDVPEPGSG